MGIIEIDAEIAAKQQDPSPADSHSQYFLLDREEGGLRWRALLVHQGDCTSVKIRCEAIDPRGGPSTMAVPGRSLSCRVVVRHRVFDSQSIASEAFKIVVSSAKKKAPPCEMAFLYKHEIYDSK